LPSLGQGSRLLPGAALQRVTILAARTDTVVVQADYFDPQPLALAPRPPVLESPFIEQNSRESGAVRRPVQLYARTQRGEDLSKAPLLDVFA
jgi:hypothetical protein